MTRYYVYDGESYDASYTTPEEARKAAIRALDGWADEAAPVAWGEVREIATLIPHAGAVEEDGLDDRGVDYELRAPDDDLTHAALSTPEGYVGAVSEAVAEELERVRADFAALRVEHEAVCKDRDDERGYLGDIGKRLDTLWNLLCSNDSALPKDIMTEVEPGGHLIDEAARLLQMVARERDELRAALLNERGEGEPPNEGWAWAPRESTDMVGRVLRRYYAWLKGPEDRGFEVLREPDGRWSVALEMDQISYYPTARDAMRAADAALAGGKA